MSGFRFSVRTALWNGPQGGLNGSRCSLLPIHSPATMNTKLKQYLRLAEQADSNAVEYEPFKIKDKVSIQVSAITRSVA